MKKGDKGRKVWGLIVVLRSGKRSSIVSIPKTPDKIHFRF
jgi:hypothetical protein